MCGDTLINEVNPISFVDKGIVRDYGSLAGSEPLISRSYRIASEVL